MTFEELVKKSGDSEFLRMEYDGFFLRLFFRLDDTDEEIELSVKTENIRTKLTANADTAHNTCLLSYEELIHSLSVENGHFVPDASFSGFMNETRKRLSLGYGFKASPNIGLLTLHGNQKLVACLVGSVSDIRITNIS